MVVLPVELHQLALEVGAHRPKDLLQLLEMDFAEYPMAVLGNEHQMGVQQKNTVPTRTNVAITNHAY